MKKYLGYAIGEILLVVIGILIALSINNWNMDRLQEIELNGYLEKIAANMEEDQEMARNYGVQRKRIRLNAKAAMELINKDEFDLTTMVSAAACFVEFYFNSDKSGFEALKNSGFLGKIENQKLDSLLSQYNKIVKRIEDEERGFNQFLEAIEVEWLMTFSSGRLLEFFPQESISDIRNTLLEKELRPAMESDIFEAAVARTSLQIISEQLYLELIKTSNAFIEEVRNN